MKEEPPEQVIGALRRILGGQIYLSDKMSARLLERVATGPADQDASLIDALTNRELEVFELIGRGLGTRDIAKELHRSVKTIETHRENIKKKLNLQDANELRRHAFVWTQEQLANE